MKAPPPERLSSDCCQESLIEEQAALFALGLLHGVERSDFEQSLERGADPEAKAALREFEQALSRAPCLRPKLCALSAAPPPGIEASSSHSLKGPEILTLWRKIAWKPSAVPGALFAVLSRQPGSSLVSGVSRFPPGCRWQGSAGHQPEEVILLAGDLKVGRRSCGPHDYLWFPPSAVINALATEAGVWLFVRGSLYGPFLAAGEQKPHT